MSYGIQTTATLTELNLFAADSEQGFEEFDSTLPENKRGVEFKGYSGKSSFLCKQGASQLKATLKSGDVFTKTVTTPMTPVLKSPMTHVAALNSKNYTPAGAPFAQKSEAKPQSFQAPLAKQEAKQDASPSNVKPQTPPQGEKVVVPQGRPQASLQTSKTAPATLAKLNPTTERQHSNTLNKQHNSQNESPLERYSWKKEETQKWWEARYHEREKEGGNQQQQQQEDEGKCVAISKSASISNHHTQTSNSSKRKPMLPAPKIGAFALYYILTKMGIFSDGSSNFAYKKEIEFVDSETSEVHKKRLDDIKLNIDNEKQAARWGIAIKVFSWIASLIAIITGVVLIATGVGAVAGAMLIAGATIQLGSQLMELTGGWKKIADLLPGEDTEKKRAVISWMQIGIAVLCLALSGAGVLWTGMTSFGEAMQTAMSVIGGVATMGMGVCSIGEGITSFFYKDKLGDVKAFDRRLAQLKHMRQDLMEKVELGLDRLEKLFEDLAQALEFEEELFWADQMINRR